MKYQINCSYNGGGDAYILQRVDIHFNHTVCFRLLQIINLKIFQIGAFFRLASDWFQTGFRLARRISDCVFRFNTDSDCFRFISDWQSEKKTSQTGSLKIFILQSKNIIKTSGFVFAFQIALDWPEMAARYCQLGRDRRCRKESIDRVNCFCNKWQCQTTAKISDMFLLSLRNRSYHVVFRWQSSQRIGLI